MAFQTSNWIQETSTSTGTGNLSLAGARTPGATFSSVCANGDTFEYSIGHESLNEYETGLGTYNTSGNTISRTTVFSSSNGGSLVNFSTGVKLIDLTLTSQRILSSGNQGTDNTGGATITFGNGDFFNLITSTTAITAFAFTIDRPGRAVRVRFQTVRTVTHNATSLILPTGTNITTAVGDTATLVSLGSGNFLCTDYQKADGTALVVTGSTSIISTGGQVQRAALTGEVTATQNANSTTITRSTNFQSSPWTGDHQFSSQVIYGTQQNETAPGGFPLSITLNDTTSRLYILVSGTGNITEIVPAGGVTRIGRQVEVYVVGSGVKTFKHATGTTVSNILGPNNADFQLINRGSFLLVGDGTNGWLVFNIHPGLSDGSRGQMVLSNGATTWNLDSSVAGAGLTGGAGTALAVGAGTGITVNADDVAVTAVAAGRVYGNQVDAGGSAIVALTGDEVGELIRYLAVIPDTTSTGSIATYPITSIATQVRFSGSGAATIHGMTATSATFGKRIEFHVEDGVAGTLTFTHESGSAGASGERCRTPSGLPITLKANDSISATYYDNRWRFSGLSRNNPSSTTQTITGTDTTTFVTPDSLAALWEQGTDNAGTSTITLGDGGFFNLITSTVAITAFAFTTDKAGRTAHVRFQTARTLTHNATSLILPTSANITTAAGDTAIIISLGSGNFLCSQYLRANGNPLSLAFAASQTVTTGSDFTITSQNDVIINAGDTAGGVAIHAGVTPKTGANDNRVTLTADDQVILEPTNVLRVFTSSVERLEIEATGAWQLGGNVGSAGQVITSAGAGAPPTWSNQPTAGLTGVLRADSGVVSVDTDVTDIVTSASDTVQGKVELATTTETITGTDATRALTPDGLASLWEQGTDNSDGATITLGEGGFFNLITSTTTITAFAFTNDKAGRTANIHFATSRVLTHNATSLILPTGGTSVLTAVGDRIGIVSLGGGNFRVLWYQRGSGSPVINPNASTSTSGITLLATTTATQSGVATTSSTTPDGIAALWEQGTDNTDGATITLGEGGFFNLITSTTAITAFALTVDKAGRAVRVRFQTVRTLTHNATSLILPSGANITTVVGDTATFISLGSGNFLCTQYTRANGRPITLPTDGLTGVLRADSGTVSVDTDVTDIITAASDTAQGKVELATTTETITGTDAARAVTPDSLAALWEAGTDNTGGATITLGEGGSFNLITSTTAITAFAFTTDKAGRQATIRFNTIRTLTHNATSLILPGAANITTAVGDICTIESLGSGNFRVNHYDRASGLPLVAPTVGGVLTLTSAQTVTAATTNLTTGAYTISAGTLQSGSEYYFEAFFFCGRGATTTATNLIIELLINGVAIRTHTLAINTSASQNRTGRTVGTITVYTTGGSGTCMVSLQTVSDVVGTVNTLVPTYDPAAAATAPATTTIDTTVSRTVELRMRLSAATATVYIHLLHCSITKVR